MPTEQESRQVAESARETQWAERGFLREVFLGRLRADWVTPFPSTEIRPEAAAFLDQLSTFLEREVDSVEIDRTGQYPEHVLARLRSMGAFGMKIEREYGGLGFNSVEYGRAIELCARHDASIVALLSAHQSIGLPQPLHIFGTEAQKQKYLPRCAAGAISAFALTEPDVGSDPASLSTTAERQADGSYVITGQKLWCTNGTIADVLVVLARDPITRRISAFIVEADTPGVNVVHRCRFMGIRAIANALIRFDAVHVPKENLIGKEGDGLRIALVTLNTGRLSLPAACVGLTKRCTEIVRAWSNTRVQWGLPIGRHEAIAHKIADITANSYAIESMTLLASELSLLQGYDIRLEAAAAKEWATVRAWEIVDATMQIRGGRGYETETSLRDRGEEPIGVERMMRDTRINLIFEGSSEIMHLFMAREAVDKHLAVAGKLIDPKASAREKLFTLPRVILFYFAWYLGLLFRRLFAPEYAEYGMLARHLRFCHRAAAALAMGIFHGMVLFRAKLERRQAFLFRVVDIANEIFATTACISRASSVETSSRERRSNMELADAFALGSRRRIKASFRALFDNDDVEKTRFASHALEGRHAWMERTHTGMLQSEPPLPVISEPAQRERKAG